MFYSMQSQRPLDREIRSKFTTYLIKSLVVPHWKRFLDGDEKTVAINIVNDPFFPNVSDRRIIKQYLKSRHAHPDAIELFEEIYRHFTAFKKYRKCSYAKL